MTLSYKDLYLVAMALLMATTLVACGTITPRGKQDQAEQEKLAHASQLENTGDRQGAAAIYWDLAKSKTSPNREELQIRAIEILIHPETRDTARRYLSEMDDSALKGKILTRKRLAEAEVALLFNQSEAALRALALATDTLTPSDSIRAQKIRARALAINGEVLASVRTRIELSKQLTDLQEQRDNTQAIWETLAGASVDELYQWRTENKDREILGWLDLAYLSKTAPLQEAQLQTLLEQWQQQYPNHPGAPEFTTLLLDDWKALQIRPNQIAVLLPLSGPYADVANAVWAGITTAFYTRGEATTQPVLKVYDVGADSNDVQASYQQAIEEGANAVIGPLKKDNATHLAQLGQLPIPVLTLNYINPDIESPENLYQFGLLPEDEARQAGERAWMEGHRQAIAFVPANDWGLRLGEAFRNRFEQLGGAVRAIAEYQTKDADHSAAIRHALLLDESQSRFERLKQTLRQNIKFEPRYRDDVDMVFMGAAPRQARLLKPQLKFHYAADLPVYATSHIFSGIENANDDRDMNGIRYCDIPWTSTQQNPESSVKHQLEKILPNRSIQFPRFVALGIDAYNILPGIKRLAAKPYERYTGLTGRLSINEWRRIYRELGWAEFVKGKPIPLEELTLTPPEDDGQ